MPDVLNLGNGSSIDFKNSIQGRGMYLIGVALCKWVQILYGHTKRQGEQYETDHSEPAGRNLALTRFRM